MLISKLLVISLLALPMRALAQTDPLDPSYMPVIDQNAADYPSNIWVTGPLAKVLQNTGSPGTTHWAIVYAMQNEFQSFQVHIQAPAGGISNLNVAMSDLVNSRTGTHISASSTDIVVYRESYLNITNITAVSKTYLGATGFYPDILIPAVDPYYHQTTNAFPFNVAANNNQSVWIDVHVPPTAPSGYYSGTITVNSGSAVLATLPVIYAVWAWKMPSTATLLTVNGVGFPAMCNQAYGGYAGCGAYPGAGGNADLGVTLSQVDLAVLMLDHRNTLISNVYPPFPNASPYTQFETYYGPLLSGTPANTATILPGAKANTVSPWFASSITQTTAQNAINEFTSKGWGSTLFDYICDEPPNGCSWSTLISNANGPHAASPQVPTLVTTDISAATANGALNSIDWMVPIINNMDPQGGSLQRSAYNAWLAGSPIRKLFSYQSCESAGTCSKGVTGGSNATWPNYNVDGMPVANRAMEWLTYFHQQTGELYYDATYCWTAPANDAYQSCGPTGALTNDPWQSVYYSGGNGDGTLVYPGTQAKIGVTKPIFLPSIRLKIQRDGSQDYEYLYALNAAGQGAFVQQQITSWITNSYTFNNDPSNNGTFSGTITAARQALGTKLHQLTYPTTSDTMPPTAAITSPANGATVSGAITVSGTAADNVSVANVQVSLDGGAFAVASGTRNWTFSLNTAGLTNASHTLAAKATDTSGNATTASVGITVSNGVSTAPFAWWTFNETSGSVAADSSGHGDNGTLTGGYSHVSGIFNNAAGFDGSTGFMYSATQLTGPQTFSVALWFKTTTAAGGKLIGFGNAQTGASSSYDRNLYMSNSGQVYFGVYSGAAQAINTSNAYNDGKWHLAAASLAADGMKLYVDGVLAASNASVTSAQNFNGYWRIGYDNLWGWTSAPTSSFFNGTIDDARVYTRELSAAEVASLYGAAALADTTPPTAGITSPANGATVSGTISVSGTAADNAAVANVQISVDGGTLGAASGTSNWTFSLNTASLGNGNHTITAQATDTSGNISSSATISIAVNNFAPDTIPPSVPMGLNAVVISSTQINLSWTASTDNVGVAGYKMFRGGVQISTPTITSFPDASLLPSTTYTYAVSAFDTAGNVSALSIAVSVVTAPSSPPSPSGDTTPPSVMITSPYNGATVSGKTNILAAASDNVAVSHVDFYVDGVLLLSVAAYPYSVTWRTRNYSNGAHILTAKAYDTSGNSAQSQITVTVKNGSTVASIAASDFYDPSFTWIDTAQGAAINDEDTRAQLFFFPGAVAPSTQTILTMTPLNPGNPDAQLQALSARALGLAGAGGGLSLGPEGMQFTQPINLRLAVSPCSADAGLYYWNPAADMWQAVAGSTFDQTTCRVIGNLGHFSTYAAFSPVAQSTIALGQVYVLPNPVKGNKQPTFHIEAASGESAQIKVFDVGGNLVNQQTISGPPSVITRAGRTTTAYEAAWDASRQGSGVYFYTVTVRLQGGTAKASGKLVIIR